MPRRSTLVAALCLAAGTTHAFDFGEAWQKVQETAKDVHTKVATEAQKAGAKAQELSKAAQAKAAEVKADYEQIDWKAIQANAQQSLAAAKLMANQAATMSKEEYAKVQAIAQNTNWTEVAMEAKAAIAYSKQMASETQQFSKDAQARFAAINWTEVGAGLQIAGEAGKGALGASAQAALQNAKALGHTAKALEGLQKAGTALAADPNKATQEPSASAHGQMAAVAFVPLAFVLLVALQQRSASRGEQATASNTAMMV